MLDSFLEVAYGKTKHAQEMDRRVQLMRKLPNELLMKIASGEEKLGYPIGLGGDEPGTWLDRFKDTPLFEEALEIEKQELENRMADQQRRQEEQANWQARDSARDELCIRRKMLELQLAELESGGGEQEMPEEAMEAPTEAAPEQGPVEQPPESKEALAAARMKTAMMKTAMTLQELEQRTLAHGRSAGAKWGRRRGAKSGAKGGAGPGALAGTVTGLALGGKRRLGRAAVGMALGGTTGATLGGAVGAKKGKRIGTALGERAAREKNLQRRAMIGQALQMRAARQQALARARSQRGVPGKGMSKGGEALLSKEAVGLLAAGRGMLGAMKAGWRGAGAAKAKGISGLTGAVHHGGKYMGALAKTSPGTAAGLGALGVAVPAAGLGYAMG